MFFSATELALSSFGTTEYLRWCCGIQPPLSRKKTLRPQHIRSFFYTNRHPLSEYLLSPRLTPAMLINRLLASAALRSGFAPLFYVLLALLPYFNKKYRREQQWINLSYRSFLFLRGQGHTGNGPLLCGSFFFGLL